MTKRCEYLQKDPFLPINTWKAVAIFMVMGIHTTGSYVLGYGSLRALHQVLLLNVLVSGAVAMFLFVSGYGLTKKHRRDGTLKWNHFVLPKLQKLLPEYVLWSVAYEIFQYKLYAKPLSVVIFLQDLMWGKAMYHLYYMVFFMEFMALFPLLLPILRRFGYKLLLVAGVVQWISFRYVPYPWSSISCTSYIFYFVWGMAVAHSATKDHAQEKQRKTWIFCGLGTALYLISCSIKFIEYESQYNVGKTPIRLLGYDTSYFFQAVATIFLALQLIPWLDSWMKEKEAGPWRKRAKNLIQLLGMHSSRIYYFHPMILGIGIELGGRYTVTAGGIKVLLLWFALTAGSLLSAMGIQRLQQAAGGR